MRRSLCILGGENLHIGSKVGSNAPDHQRLRKVLKLRVAGPRVGRWQQPSNVYSRRAQVQKAVWYKHKLLKCKLSPAQTVIQS